MLWGLSEMVSARPFKPLPCVQHLWQLTSRDIWSSRNEWKPPCQQKCVLRKCCGVYQKWWMLELANLCHCVQYPWKLTTRDFFWSSRNERKPLCQQKMCFEKMLWGIPEMMNARAFKPLPLCSAPLKILLAVICGALGTQESHLSMQICFLRKCCRVSQKWWMLELANLCHCVQYPSTLTSRHFFGALRMTESHYVSQNVFWENAAGYLRNGEC